MAKHTPTPWRLYHGKLRPGMKNTILEIVCTGDTRPVVMWQGFDDCSRTKSEHTANARYIIETVNTHDKLVSDRKVLLDALQFIASNEGCTSITYKEHEIPWNSETIAVLANAAIEQAEKES